MFMLCLSLFYYERKNLVFNPIDFEWYGIWLSQATNSITMEVFDQITLLILGAMLGRSIVTNQPCVVTLDIVLMLMLLHRIVGWIAFYSPKASRLINGDPILLIKNGEIEWKKLRKAQFTVANIQATLREGGQEPEIEKVKECYLNVREK
jgi:uncharacterized membrane protein YcaP (DUF421 family)